MLKESLKMSWKNITQSKMRSFLTTLGIVIGVTAIIALITIVQGVIDDINEQFDSVGANTLVIAAMGTPLKQGLTDKEIIEIGNIEGVSGVLPSISTITEGYGNDIFLDDVDVKGANETFFQRNASFISQGRGINVLDVEGKNRVCVISDDFQKEMFVGKNAIGEKIVLYGTTYTVIGIAGEGDASVMTLMGGGNTDIYIPYKNLMNMTRQGSVMNLEVYMSDEYEDTTFISDAVDEYLLRTFNNKENSYSLIKMDSLLDMMKSTQAMLTTALTGIASIALLVGGIGIMNMMLVSVTERTVEIGLRKALGAEPRTIQIQFLMEAIMLSLLGGVIGILLGLGISLAAALAMGTTFKIFWSAIALGVGFSGGVGIIFGFTPAKKASELNPIDALRSM